MAITVTAPGTLPANAIVEGSRKLFIGIVAFDTSYPTGGYTLTPAAMGGLVQLDAVVCLGGSKLGRIIETVVAAGVWSLKVNSADLTEVNNGTDVSADSATVLAIGF